MAESSTARAPGPSRAPGRGKHKATGRERGAAQTLAQKQVIETGVLRAPAQDLQRLLEAALSLWERPPAEEHDGEEDGTEEGREDEDADAEDPFEGSGIEDAEADAEGDGTEPLDGDSLDGDSLDGDSLDGDSLDDVPLGQSEAAPPVDDVLVEKEDVGGHRRLRCYSGLSDHLLRLQSADPTTRLYHDALRLRIASTLFIVRAVAAENAPFLQSEGGAIAPLRRDVVRDALGLTEERFSNLLTEATLRTPAGDRHRLDAFFVRYSADESTEAALVGVLAQRADQDRRAAQDREPGGRRQALTDGAWLEYVNDARRELGLPVIGKAALAEARLKRLGLPGSAQRPKLYAQGLSVIGMISRGGAEAALLQKWKRLLQPLLTHKNAKTRQTATDWLAELEVRLAEVRLAEV